MALCVYFTIFSWVGSRSCWAGLVGKRFWQGHSCFRRFSSWPAISISFGCRPDRVPVGAHFEGASSSLQKHLQSRKAGAQLCPNWSRRTQARCCCFRWCWCWWESCKSQRCPRCRSRNLPMVLRKSSRWNWSSRSSSKQIDETSFAV